MGEKRTLNEVKIKPTAKSTAEIGIDTKKTFLSDIIDLTQVGSFDLSSIDALVQSAQGREQSYEIIDQMAQDTLISAVLETYAEDTVQTNDRGQIVWVESADSKVLDYTTWLLDSLNADKHLYRWAYCLITYGDVYLRLFRQSDVDEDKIFAKDQYNHTLNESKKNKDDKNKKKINEDAKLRIYDPSDKYIPYVQMVDNPGEMFDLQKFGKSHGYIKAPTRMIQPSNDELYNYLTRYKMNQGDVEIFDAMSFVHGCIENTSQRQPETVDICLDKNPQTTDDHQVCDSMTSSYSVKRGQSILYNAFRNWRELNLLEMSALLNRLTKSSVVRILTVDVGDMGKEKVKSFVNRLKDKIEQKTSINIGEGVAEYTNPAPIENTIIVPVHGGQGQITASTVGGDFDPKSLVDIEYFRDKLFGALKVPKQYFGFTGDGAGFNGGSSLTILSSRYGKSIKNIQNILCQMITDLINLFLINRGLDNYVNKFRIRMQPPETQEEIDRRTNNDNKLRYITDIMSQMTDVKDPVVRLNIYKELLTSVVNNSKVISLLQGYIDKIDAEQKANADKSDSKKSDSSETSDNSELPPMENLETDAKLNNKEPIFEEGSSEDPSSNNDSYLPSPEELQLDTDDKD